MARIKKITVNSTTYDIGDPSNVAFGTCDTEGSQQVKSVTVPYFNLISGARAYIKFTNSSKCDSMKLNINGTGAKTVMISDYDVSSHIIFAGNVYCFVYDGTNYCLVGSDYYRFYLPANNTGNAWLTIAQSDAYAPNCCGTFHVDGGTSGHPCTFAFEAIQVYGSGIINFLGGAYFTNGSSSAAADVDGVRIVLPPQSYSSSHVALLQLHKTTTNSTGGNYIIKTSGLVGWNLANPSSLYTATPARKVEYTIVYSAGYMQNGFMHST